jgi:hypothetical protein
MVLAHVQRVLKTPFVRGVATRNLFLGPSNDRVKRRGAQRLRPANEDAEETSGAANSHERRGPDGNPIRRGKAMTMSGGNEVDGVRGGRRQGRMSVAANC